MHVSSQSLETYLKINVQTSRKSCRFPPAPWWLQQDCMTAPNDSPVLSKISQSSANQHHVVLAMKYWVCHAPHHDMKCQHAQRSWPLKTQAKQHPRIPVQSRCQLASSKTHQKVCRHPCMNDVSPKMTPQIPCSQMGSMTGTGNERAATSKAVCVSTGVETSTASMFEVSRLSVKSSPTCEDLPKDGSADTLTSQPSSAQRSCSWTSPKRFSGWLSSVLETPCMLGMHCLPRSVQLEKSSPPLFFLFSSSRAPDCAVTETAACEDSGSTILTTMAP